jgi:phosphopantetheinyl transferase
VLFGPLIERLYAAGVRVFVQVGTGSLPGFVEDTLESAGATHLTISANIPKRSGLGQLRRVAAALWSVGAAPRFDRLIPAAPEALPEPGPPSRPTPPNAGIPLRLGSALTREGAAHLPPLTGASTPPPAPRSAPLPAAADTPVLAEYHALLAEAGQAADDVLSAWQPAATTPPTTAAAPPVAPAGPRRQSSDRVLSLDSDPYLLDHCLLQAPDTAPAGERYPIVPMTGTIALITEAAAALVPERTVVGVRGVRALRPLAVDPPLTLHLEATEQPADSNDLTVVSVIVEGSPQGGERETYARATVLLADTYPTPPALREPPLTAERRPDIDAQQLYAQRWMFHGPAYRGVTELTGIAEDGVRGVLTTLPALGALLDAAGQLLGYWIAAQPDNGLVLPATIGSISFYGPPPPVGAQFHTVVRVRSASPEEAVADLELRDTAGRLWCHITGWTDRRLEGNATTIEAFRHPARAVLAEPRAGGWWLLVEPWNDPVARDLAARQYLAPVEREDHAARNPRAARRWLLGRIAAKDAVRSWLWQQGAGELYPGEIRIGNDPSGRPFVTVAGHDPALSPALSLAHSGPFAAALVGPAGSAVGIDVELVDDAPAEAALLTVAERDLLDTICPPEHPDRARWVTRFWTAKEAVAKSLGTGLAGRPARFVVTSREEDDLSVLVDGATFRVRTRVGDDPQPFAVGWTPVSAMLN